MKKKTVITIISCICLIIIVAYTSIGLCAPFGFLSGGCSTDYGNDLIYNNVKDINSSMDESMKRGFTDAEMTQLLQNINFSGRRVKSDFVTTDGESISLEGKLKWFWSEEIDWSVVENSSLNTLQLH